MSKQSQPLIANNMTLFGLTNALNALTVLHQLLIQFKQTVYQCFNNIYLPQNCLVQSGYTYKNNPNVYQIFLSAGQTIYLDVNNTTPGATTDIDIQFYYNGLASGDQIDCGCASTNSEQTFTYTVSNTGLYYYYMALYQGPPTNYTLAVKVNGVLYSTSNGVVPFDSNTYHDLQCILCSPGYYFSLDSNGNNVCQSSISNCDKVTRDQTLGVDKCIKCNFGWILNFQTNLCIYLVTFCSHYAGTQCRDCIENYTLINNKCMLVPSNCQNYSKSTGLCLNCSFGYILSSTGSCVVDNSCPDYEYRDPQTNTCINGSINNCQKYFINGLCKQCEPNYVLDSIGFTCTYIAPPIICPNNTTQFQYVVIMKTCVKVDINCQQYRSDGYCYNCNPGFYEFQGTCYSTNSNQAIDNNT